MSNGSPGSTLPADEREVVIEHVFNAPRALVWKMFTECEHLAHWWGPIGWTLSVCTLDLHVGGIWHYCMKGPEGEEAWSKAVYDEIVESERLVYTDSFSDADGDPVEGMPQSQVTLTFTEADGKTHVVSRVRFATGAERDRIVGMGMVEGTLEAWDRLATYLEQQQT